MCRRQCWWTLGDFSKQVLFFVVVQTRQAKWMPCISCLGKKRPGVYCFWSGEMEVSVITLVWSLVYNWEHMFPGQCQSCVQAEVLEDTEGTRDPGYQGPRIAQCSNTFTITHHVLGSVPRIQTLTRYGCVLQGSPVCVSSALVQPYTEACLGTKEGMSESTILLYANLYPNIRLVSSCTCVLPHMVTMPTWPEIRFYSFIFEYNRTECPFCSYYTRQNK